MVYESKSGQLLVHEPEFLRWYLGLTGRSKPRAFRVLRRVVRVLEALKSRSQPPGVAGGLRNCFCYAGMHENYPAFARAGQSASTVSL